MYKKLKEFSLIKKWAKNSNIIDIILFGSFVRGKSKPNDIDLCVIINESEESKSLDLADSLGRLLDKSSHKFQVNILTERDFLKGKGMAKTLLLEGYSLLNDKPFSEALGFAPKSLFEYSLKTFTPSKRTRFHYLLQGRNGEKGILHEFKGNIIGNGVIIVPVEYEDSLKEIFESWEATFKIKRMLLG